jgi:branched-chain amino acid transport system permease protein
MTSFLQVVINGLVLGASYALVALGYTMVYGIVRLINFAHGEVFMVGAFAALTTYNVLLPDSIARKAWVAIPLMIVVAAAVSTLLAVAMERIAYRPLRKAQRLAPLITAIGVSLFLREAVRLFYPNAKAARKFPALISSARKVRLAGLEIQFRNVIVVVLSLVLAVALQQFVQRSKTGRAMRATSMDPDTAKLMGIDTDRIIVITFALGAALAGVAGVFHGLRFEQIDTGIGFIGGLKSFTAAVLGGIGNINGALLGGLILGILENVATRYVGGQWKDATAFIVLIVLLVFRPNGLFGQQERGRA